MVMIKKQDWLNAKQQFENLIVNSKMNLMFQEQNYKIIVDKLKDMPEEEDEMPEKVKEIFEKTEK